ncbi:MAG TPA: TetR/AcrR family transcriptional regulator, partial [Acidimicrobiales bacterium]|nr:TetR/AcrR family transcriptional regulator [Acidimicrobiales bacterium]
GFNQALIFYHFGSLNELFLAAVDFLSSQRVAEYRERVEGVTSVAELIRVAADLHRQDVDRGHITVLAQLLAGATTAPELRAPLRERFSPWIEVAEQAIERVVAGTPYAAVLPVGDLAFVVTALFMGMELTMTLEPDKEREERLFRNIGLLAQMADLLLGAGTPPAPEAPA